MGQSFGDIEIIVSDNASTDATQDIVRGLAAQDKRIRYVRQQINIGANGNYTFVASAARGEYCKWVSSSDWCAGLGHRVRQSISPLRTTRPISGHGCPGWRPRGAEPPRRLSRICRATHRLVESRPIISSTISASVCFLGERVHVMTVAEHRAIVGERRDLAQAVRDEYDRKSVLSQTIEDPVDALHVHRGKCRGRLVEYQVVRDAQRAISIWRREERSRTIRLVQILAMHAGKKLFGAAALGAPINQLEFARRLRRANVLSDSEVGTSDSSWKIATTPASMASLGLGNRTGRPSSSVVPELGWTTPLMILMKGPIPPAPFSPRTASPASLTVSPCFRARLLRNAC